MKTLPFRGLPLVCLLAWLPGAAPVALAQFTLSPVAVIGTDLGTSAPEASVTNMINQSGVTAPFVSGSTGFDDYFASPGTTFANATATNNWQSDYTFDLPLTGTVDFDLGASYLVHKLAIWNISLKDVTVRFSETLDDLPTGESAGDFTLVNHLFFSFSYPVDLLSFTNSYTARYLRLEIHSAYTFSPSDTFAYAIVGEVVVSATALGGSPTVAVALSPGGNAEITFTGILQSSTNAAGMFEDVSGNPSSPYTLPPGSQLPEQYFRARTE